MVLAVLPLFVTAGLGAPAFAVGVVEGVADGSAALVKVASGWYSDRTGRRKAIAVAGYATTVVGHGALVLIAAWPLVVVARGLAWMGRGLRQPIRSAMLAGSVRDADLGKAFGFHEALDTVGALLGPAVAWAILATGGSFRTIFLIALAPGVLTVLAFATLTGDPRRAAPAPAPVWQPLPRQFWRLVAAVAVFGAGNFAPAFLILRAAEMLRPELGRPAATAGAILFFIGYNAVGAAASFPAGWLADRLGQARVLTGAYLLFALACLAGVAGHGPIAVGLMAIPAGAQAALVTAGEHALAGALVEERIRGTAYGVLNGVNGLGDLVSSLLTGALWTLAGPVAGLLYGTLLAVAGAAALAILNPKRFAPA